MQLDPTEPTIATVFGGTGFIGRYVVQRLARRGWRVRVPCRDPSKALFLKPFGVPGQIAPLFANIRDDASVAAAVAGAHVVVNLVGVLYERGRNTFEAIQHRGAGRVAAAAAAAGARSLVQVSAIGADPESPAAYARAKAAGERDVQEAFPTATILRPSIVFGPEDAFFNRFAAMAQLSPFLPLIGGGQTRFQPVYVADVADAVMRAIDMPEAKGCTYELGGPAVYTFAELMRLMLRETGRSRLLLPVPWGLARLQARVLGLLPKPPLTTDQVTLLERDNVVSEGAKTLSDLGISATPAEAILPTYMVGYRAGGSFAGRDFAA